MLWKRNWEVLRCRKTPYTVGPPFLRLNVNHVSSHYPLWRGLHRRCLAHIINLATQVLISTRSKAKYYNPHNIDEHTPDVDALERDELGLIRAISVKVRLILFALQATNNTWFRNAHHCNGRSSSDHSRLEKVSVTQCSCYLTWRFGGAQHMLCWIVLIQTRRWYQCIIHISWACWTILISPSLSMNLFMSLVFVLKALMLVKKLMPSCSPSQSGTGLEYFAAFFVYVPHIWIVLMFW